MVFALFVFLAAQDAPVPSFAAAASQVHVQARVVDGSGKSISGLTAADFVAFDNGTEQSIRHVDSDALPLDLVLLLDVSPSMLFQLRKVAAAAVDAVQELRPGDRVAIHSFCRKHKEFLPFTEDKAVLLAGLNRLSQRGNVCAGTVLNSAIAKAALTLQSQASKQSRRAVLLFTDNKAFRGMPDSVLLDQLAEADASLNALIYTPDGKTVRRLGLGADARPLAEASGGDWLPAKDASTAFREILERIRNRYVIYYNTPESSPGTRHEVRLALAQETRRLHPNARVLARKNYTAKLELK